MRLSRHKIEERLKKATTEDNGWVSFEPMNDKGRLLTMDELRAMPLARLVALVRRVHVDGINHSLWPGICDTHVKSMANR